LTETVQPKASTVTQPKPVFKANSGFVGIKGVKPVQPIEIWDLNLGLEGGPDLGDGSLMVGQVSINAIGGASERSPMLTVASAATQHILRNVAVPKFSGHSSDWLNFKGEWVRFIRKFNQVSEADKLGLLELCLDDLGKKQLNLHLDEMGEALTFNEVWAKLDAWHSRNEEFGARKSFRDLTLCHQGRVTSRDWENFKVDFKLCRQKIKDASEGEVKRLLIEKMPPFIVHWITDNETVRMNYPQPTTTAVMENFVMVFTGKKPTRVTKLSETEFEIVLPDVQSCETLKSYNGKEFNDSNVLVRVRENEPNLSVEDIFRLVTSKLALRDRQDLMLNPNHSQTSYRRSRSVVAEIKGGSR
jgi:hypothetical protein